MDDDLEAMSRAELIAEARRLRRGIRGDRGTARAELIAGARRLRSGIREHRDTSGQDLCWHHPALWGLLPERTDPLPIVPSRPQFLRGCIRYRQSLDEQLPDAL